MQDTGLLKYTVKYILMHYVRHAINVPHGTTSLVFKGISVAAITSVHAVGNLAQTVNARDYAKAFWI